MQRRVHANARQSDGLPIQRDGGPGDIGGEVKAVSAGGQRGRGRGNELCDKAHNLIARRGLAAEDNRRQHEEGAGDQRDTPGARPGRKPRRPGAAGRAGSFGSPASSAERSLISTSKLS